MDKFLILFIASVNALYILEMAVKHFFILFSHQIITYHRNRRAKIVPSYHFFLYHFQFALKPLYTPESSVTWLDAIKSHNVWKNHHGPRSVGKSIFLKRLLEVDVQVGSICRPKQMGFQVVIFLILLLTDGPRLVNDRVFFYILKSSFRHELQGAFRNWKYGNAA